MVDRPPTILTLAEAQFRAGPEDSPFLDYTQHVMLPADGKTGACLAVYVYTGTTTRATLLLGKEDANALLMHVVTPRGEHHVLAAHALQINIGYEPHARWWADICREVTRILDATSILVVIDTNSAAKLADRGSPRTHETGYPTFVRAFTPRDLVDVHTPPPPETYSCFQGAARSRIDGVACHCEATFTIASHHYWGSNLVSDDRVPLLFSFTYPVARLDKPSPNTLSHTPDYHLGLVALSPADTPDFQSSVPRRGTSTPSSPRPDG